MEQLRKKSPLFLVVDDHDLVRELVVNILTVAGMRSVEAASGQEAIEVFTAQSANIDGVLLDLSMPDMSGAQTLRRLRQVDGDIPILLMSAHQRAMGQQAMGGERGVGFVQKPFQPAALIEAVHRLLGR